MKDSYVFYKDKLNTEYKPVFEQVEMYVSMQNIDEATLEERLGDLLDIFLSSQDAGKPVQKIVGNNIEYFCKTFCSDFGVKNRVLWILDWLKTVAWMLIVLSAIDILWFLFDADNAVGTDIWHIASSLNISLYFVSVILFGVLHIAISTVLCRMMFKTKRVSMTTLKIVACAEAVISFGGIFSIMYFCKTNLFDAPTWIVALISCLYLLLYYPLFGKRLKRRKIRLSELVQSDTQSEIAKYMEKRFEKAKKKNLKKGRGELSLEEFLDMEERSCRRAEKLKIFYSVLPFAATALFYIIEYLTEGFETPLDSVLFILIMLGTECFVLWGLWKIVKHGIEMRRAWIKVKRNEINK